MLENATSTPAVLPDKELENTVWVKDVCAGDRACVTVCPANTLAYDHETHKPYTLNPCIDCKACLDICPRTPANLKVLRTGDVIGPFIDITSAKSALNVPRSQNGGVVTTLLTTAFEEDFIDCALVMGGDRWAQKAYPLVARSPEDLKKTAGSKYNSNGVIETLKEVAKDPSIRNIAIVGTPCTIEAIGLLRKSSNEYNQKLAAKIRFAIGLFCFEVFDDSFIEEVTSKLSVPSWKIEKINAGEGKLTVYLRDGEIKAIPLQSLSDKVRMGCQACGDFTARMSDISVGSVGSGESASTVIIRTPEGKGLFEIAESTGRVNTVAGVDKAAIEKVGKLKFKKNNKNL